MAIKSKTKSIEVRLDTFEAQLAGIVGEVNGAFQAQIERLGQFAQVLEAVTELVGVEMVDAKIKEISERKVQERIAQAKEALKQGIASGELVPATVITDKSMLVGRETDKDGNVVEPGHIQLPMDRIAFPTVREQLVGQGVGFKVQTPAGNTFEVLEVYDVVPKPAASPMPEPTTEEIAAMEAEISDIEKAPAQH